MRTTVPTGATFPIALENMVPTATLFRAPPAPKTPIELVTLGNQLQAMTALYEAPSMVEIHRAYSPAFHIAREYGHHSFPSTPQSRSVEEFRTEEFPVLARQLMRTFNRLLPQIPLAVVEARSLQPFDKACLEGVDIPLAVKAGLVSQMAGLDFIDRMYGIAQREAAIYNSSLLLYPAADPASAHRRMSIGVSLAASAALMLTFVAPVLVFGDVASLFSSGATWIVATGALLGGAIGGTIGLELHHTRAAPLARNFRSLADHFAAQRDRLVPLSTATAGNLGKGKRPPKSDPHTITF